MSALNVSCCELWPAVMERVHVRSGARIGACDAETCAEHPVMRAVLAYGARTVCGAAGSLLSGSPTRISCAVSDTVLAALGNATALAFYASLLPLSSEAGAQQPALDRPFAEYDTAAAVLELRHPLAAFSREVYDAVVVCVAVLLVANIALAGGAPEKVAVEAVPQVTPQVVPQVTPQVMPQVMPPQAPQQAPAAPWLRAPLQVHLGRR